MVLVPKTPQNLIITAPAFHWKVHILKSNVKPVMPEAFLMEHHGYVPGVTGTVVPLMRARNTVNTSIVVTVAKTVIVIIAGYQLAWIILLSWVHAQAVIMAILRQASTRPTYKALTAATTAITPVPGPRPVLTTAV